MDSLFLGRCNMKYDKKSAVRIITEAARNYDSYLNRKNFLIVYQEGKEVKYTEVGFRDMNFLHLRRSTDQCVFAFGICRDYEKVKRYMFQSPMGTINFYFYHSDGGCPFLVSIPHGNYKQT